MEFAVQRPGPLHLEATNLELEWKTFFQKFEIFLLASGSEGKSGETRLAMLLNFAGDEALKLYNTFTYDNTGDEKNFETVIDKFRSYCIPRRNIVYERYQFWQLTQQPGESVDSFATTLRAKASSCDFGDQTESMIRDRIVLGHPVRQTQERLLRECDLTLQKALDICRASESTREQLNCSAYPMSQLQSVQCEAENKSPLFNHVVLSTVIMTQAVATVETSTLLSPVQPLGGSVMPALNSTTLQHSVDHPIWQRLPPYCRLFL